MDELLLACSGITHGPFTVPSFTLRRGGDLCLHIPDHLRDEEERWLVRCLSGEISVPGLDVRARVEEAPFAVQPAGLRGLFSRPSIAAWLRRNARVDGREVEAIVARLPDGGRPVKSMTEVGRLPGTLRAFLGLEAAWARGAEVVIYTTAGLDPSGRETVYAAVAARLPQCAAIHLSHRYITQDRRERDHLPGASCVEIVDRREHRLTA